MAISNIDQRNDRHPFDSLYGSYDAQRQRLHRPTQVALSQIQTLPTLQRSQV